MRKCTNCLHCKTNIVNESECCLGHEINTPECSTFAPKNEYVEEYLQQDKKENVVPSVLTWAGVGSIAFSIYFCCLGWLEGSWGNPYLWTLLVIGIICLAVAGIMPLVLRLRRESLKQEVRKELENEVRSDVAPKILTRNIIKDYLEQQSLSPEPIDGNEGFKFISHDIYFKLFYDGDYSLTIRYGCELEENDVKIAEKILDSYEGKVLGCFRRVYELPKEDGSITYALICDADFFVEYVDHFKRVFPRYLHSVELAVNNLFVSLNRCKREMQSVTAPRRDDIYQPEYLWFSGLVKSISQQATLAEALVDEDWIRKEIQSKCQDEAIRAEWDSFKINRVDRYGDYKLIIYQFPEPKVAPEAKYGAVLLNSTSLEGNYYTLEMSIEDRWYYGGVSEDRHLNYGEAPSDSLDQFIEWILGGQKTVEASTDYTKM